MEQFEKSNALAFARSDNSSHLSIQNVPSGNKELNAWALNCLGLQRLIKDKRGYQ